MNEQDIHRRLYGEDPDIFERMESLGYRSVSIGVLKEGRYPSPSGVVGVLYFHDHPNGKIAAVFHSLRMHTREHQRPECSPDPDIMMGTPVPGLGTNYETPPLSEDDFNLNIRLYGLVVGEKVPIEEARGLKSVPYGQIRGLV